MSDKNLNRWFIALALAGGLIIETDSRADSVPPRVQKNESSLACMDQTFEGL